MLSASVSSGISSAGDISPAPGRTTSSAPPKVSATSAQRALDTRSPNWNAEKIVISNGVSMMMAVSSPTGITRRLRNEHTLVDMISAPRSTCSPGWRVCNSARPRCGHCVSTVTDACVT